MQNETLIAYCVLHLKTNWANLNLTSSAAVFLNQAMSDGHADTIEFLFVLSKWKFLFW